MQIAERYVSAQLRLVIVLTALSLAASTLLGSTG